MGFILSGIYFGWGSLKTGFSFGEIRVRRDSVLARFALGEIHFGGISDDGFWNGGILSYSPRTPSIYFLRRHPDLIGLPQAIDTSTVTTTLN